MSEWILTIIGPDRPGLVEAVAERVVARGGNWMASRMAHLGGKFAGIAHVAIPEAELEHLRQELDALEAEDLLVRVESATTAMSGSAEGAAQTMPALVLLQVVGSDRPGIVREISGVLAAAGINLESLSTDHMTAPMTGGPLFRAEVQFALPAGLSLVHLGQAVDAVAGDLMVEFSPVVPLQTE